MPKSPKVKPIIKFNNGRGAIICNECRVIIKENLSRDEIQGKTDLLYCQTCERKLKLNKLNKSKK